MIDGNIKMFIDLFNKELDIEIDKISNSILNINNVYNDAIGISLVSNSLFPNDRSVSTIGDLFKFTFPDLNSDSYIEPPKYISNGFIDEHKRTVYKTWLADFNRNQTINNMFNVIKRGLGGNDKLVKYSKIKRPGITNPSIYSPGLYYFDTMMYLILSKYSDIIIADYDVNSNDDYNKFIDILLDINDDIIRKTGIDISIFDSYIFRGLKPYINGEYKLIFLYNAFIQAGNDYKTSVLPYEGEYNESDELYSAPVESEVSLENFKFDVRNREEFIVTSDNKRNLKLRLINYYSLDEEDILSDEYMERDFNGTESDIWLPSLDNNGYLNTDVELLNDIKENSAPTETRYLSTDRDSNAKEIVKQCIKKGITNRYAIIGILSVVYKECGFIPRSESTYSKTSTDRIIKIFGRRGLDNSQWEVLKKDDEKFFNFVYGGKNGNGQTDGFRYRGRGFNQITFKGTYKKYSDNTGYDILNDPDLLNSVEVAAACVVEFIYNSIRGSSTDIKNRYNFSDINSFNTLDDGIGAIYHANAGLSKPYEKIILDPTGGRKKAFDYGYSISKTYNSLFS